MIFSTYLFILVFLPITFLGYRLLSHFLYTELSKVWLILASLFFYWHGSGSFVLAFIASVIFNYLIGISIIRASGPHAQLKKKLLLTVGLTENIVLLGYYKYANFVIENVNFLMDRSYNLMDILLPLGISFFTFQLIAFLVDCYKGQTEEYSFINYLVFITFFPQLIVGPIVHHKEVVPQLEDEKRTFFNKYNMMLGIFLFSMGAAKKVVLADPLTAYGSAYFADVASYDVLASWLATFSYTLSYYFDLSGYADMAIGLGLFFNIKLPQNFKSPYKARNFRDYWQRWHITLSRFLSTYIFRSVYKKGKGSFNFYFAVMVTFFVSGFWHGAGWSFVLWGIINGVFVCMSHFMRRREWQLPFIVAWILTFAGVVGTRILFVATDTAQAVTVMKKMFDFQQFASLSMTEIGYEIYTFTMYNAVTIVILLVAMAIAFFGKSSNEMKEEFKPSVKNAVIAALLLGLALAQMTAVSDFLYFQF
ncbi:D-alanyl-lipoteichoic acid acyltransferase DltB, MBOAT superfamily [Gracilibacillus ureilyticus]|uniref:D-alanyl-lipoteichoic acid acyltransferase DltB, MBOAT superfamily n=1 Tax=Gracilibacillus ureilyticus TaxID=531814 RepID=A0A1H9RDN4_9BACI|nr:MBOAT family O-acyltransferase [Gracilibacillus ureilyticus]SER70808.1 D-alanyl-lipoteichoic acid acyltransferase DltB, MBOAT superfamily [Gracilibacillus ureilyticus]